MRSRVLVIPEMEKWVASRSNVLAAQLKPMAEAFLRRGGNIVILGAETNQCTFLRQAGLIDVQRVNSSSSGKYAFTSTPAGKQIAKGIGAAFTLTNSTVLYRLGTSLKGQQSLNTNATASAIMARKVRRGWVILMGMDYYAQNAGTEKLLVNAVNMK